MVDDLVLDPNRMLPPPLIRGQVTAVWIDWDRIRMMFGVQAASRSLPPLDSTAPNYMYFRGGTLRFGKLTMSQADLQIVDEHPEDPFDFFLDQYQAQLVAGHSQTMPNQGLVTFMPDYAALRERAGVSGERDQRTSEVEPRGQGGPPLPARGPLVDVGLGENASTKTSSTMLTEIRPRNTCL